MPSQTLKERLAPFITVPPDIVQFAKDKKYEESWIIKVSSPRPSAEECKKYVEREKFALLAVEYVWNSESDDRRFVLTLYQDKRGKMPDSVEFVKASIDLFRQRPDFLSLINALDANVVGKPYLLQSLPVDSVTIGIFNYWVSTGPIDLWKKGDQYREDAIRQKITARPDMQKTRFNYQGLFFRFNEDGRYTGPYYGIKTPCCTKEGGFWLVDFPTTFRWMRFMLLGEDASHPAAR